MIKVFSTLPYLIHESRGKQRIKHRQFYGINQRITIIGSALITQLETAH